MRAYLTPISTDCQCYVAENIVYGDTQVKPNGYTPTIVVDASISNDIVRDLTEEGFREGEDFEVRQ